MDPAAAEPCRDDEGLFPSGPWRGYYTYGRAPSRHRMDLTLTFSEGRVEGDGIDDVGSFVITGTYSSENLEVLWVKTYPGRHRVHYRGFREGRGIWGTWEIAAWSTGGFRIWPAAHGEEDALREEVQEERPAAVAAPIAPETAAK